MSGSGWYWNLIAYKQIKHWLLQSFSELSIYINKSTGTLLWNCLDIMFLVYTLRDWEVTIVELLSDAIL